MSAIVWVCGLLCESRFVFIEYVKKCAVSIAEAKVKLIISTYARMYGNSAGCGKLLCLLGARESCTRGRSVT